MMAKSRPSVCILDCTSSVLGHHPALIAGLARTLIDVDGQVGVAARKPPPISTGCDWLETPPHATGRLRHIPGGRRVMRRVVEWVRRQEGRTLWDIDLNANAMWTIDEVLALPRRVHVLHNAQPLDQRSWRPNRLARQLVSRAFVRSLVRTGGKLVVHTAADADRVRSSGLDVPVHHVDFAICSRSDLEARSFDTSSRTGAELSLLFVGRARDDKGCRQLLEALAGMLQPPALHVAGTQRPQVIEQLRRDFSTVPVTWTNSWIPADELAKHFLACDLVVLPYQAGFESRGGVSAVLVEALSWGRPVVVTPPVARLLPAEFPAAVVASGTGAIEIRKAIRSATTEIDALRMAAREVGPTLVRERHTYEAYVAALRA